ncbi:ATP-binding protein [Stenotrophomonas sp.]|uniref:ATP-binding protein n=1 Tax=Stenotrophomonas sp. TaxID=69392 RepID=UPI0028ABC867|nr:ATP-binding protein [Stenotrophomonas sp.]
MSSWNASESTLDITRCASEPIRTPGAIQPYGLVLVLDARTLTVTERAVAEAGILDALGDPLGQPVEAVLGAALASCRPALEALQPDTSHFLGAHRIGDHGGHHVVAHRLGGNIIVELEAPVPGEPGSLEDLYPSIRRFMGEIERVSTTRELCDLAAAQIRELTGFDRTLVYQFDTEWNGAVVAEDGNGVLPSYLDLRFPESDIPAQARELYRQNRVRLIADSDYRPVPLVRSAANADAPPTDLSPSMLRSVSPVHLQYMRNMGTGASMSVSLLREGELWGLISCHNQAPQRVPYHVRTACEFIGQILSLQISLKERARVIEERIARRAIQVRLLGRMAGDQDFMVALGRDQQNLLALTESSGAAIVHRGECILHGHCPTAQQVMALVQWLTAQPDQGELFCTERLPMLWKDADAFSDVASGVLAISISQLHDSFVLWFRPEVIRTVRWGGDPRKEDTGLPLSPRTSFEGWKETVRKQSLAWNEVDRDAALELRTAIVDIVLRKAEEMAVLNEQLLRSNKELEAFSYSVSHDLRAPFRHIVGYSELLWASAGERLNDSEKRFLDTIVESAQSAGTLVDDLLSFSQMGRSTMGQITMDMTALVEDVRHKLDMEYAGRSIHWTLPPLPRVKADPGMVRLVWQNLLSNAIKFTRDTPHPAIAVGHRRNDTEDVFFVRDNGCGFDMRYVDKLFGVFQRLHHADEYEGTGIGLANVHRIITRHGGRTWAEGEVGVGATFFFTIPFATGDNL